MVHIIGAVRLGRHVWCGSHGGMVVRKDRVSPDLQVDDVIRRLISKGGGSGKSKGCGLFYFDYITSLKVLSCNPCEKKKEAEHRLMWLVRGKTDKSNLGNEQADLDKSQLTVTS